MGTQKHVIDNNCVFLSDELRKESRKLAREILEARKPRREEPEHCDDSNINGKHCVAAAYGALVCSWTPPSVMEAAFYKEIACWCLDASRLQRRIIDLNREYYDQSVTN